MATLTKAHQELFKRGPVECFGSLDDLYRHCSRQDGFMSFSLVDALTKLSQKARYAGDRAELDAKIGQLLALAA